MRLIRRSVKGLLAGTCGTIAMGGFAFLARRMVEPEKPMGKTHYESVVEWASGLAAPEREIAVADRIRIGELTHLGFGAFWGMIFSVINGDKTIKPLSNGAAWGTALWAVAFSGYMPALGISKSLREMGNYERLRTLGSHLVFATFTWVFLEAFRNRD